MNKNTPSVFSENNSLITNAIKALTPEQKEQYKKIGEEMYNTVNFEDNKILNNLPPPLAESLAYIKEGLKSGLQPCDLSEGEINILEEGYGKEWYKHFDFLQEDIPEKKEFLEINMQEQIKKTIEMEIEKRKVKRDEKKEKKKSKNYKGKKKRKR